MNAYVVLLLGAGLLQTPQSGLNPTLAVTSSAYEAGFSMPAVSSTAPVEAGSCGDVGCGDCCDDCSSGHRHHCESTCDMPPHYPYEPMFHGYYYFRPYNDSHVLEHKALAERLGAEPRAPYSTAMFQKIYESTAAPGDHVHQPAAAKPLPPIEPQLPDLQDLLRKSRGK